MVPSIQAATLWGGLLILLLRARDRLRTLFSAKVAR